MSKDGPIKAVFVVTLTALLCSLLVTVTVLKLRPVQHAYQDLERNRFLVGVSGLTDDAAALSDREIIRIFQSLDVQIIDLENGAADDRYNPDTFDYWNAATDPTLSVTIPSSLDIAKLRARSRIASVYFVHDSDGLIRIILPIYGQGMWSQIFGFIALEPDLNTIADVSFFAQAETAGIGDQILNPRWQSLWRGKKLYDEAGIVRFEISHGRIEPLSPHGKFHVDAISGATITTDGVSNLVNYWLGPHGFGPFLDSYRRLDYR